MYTSVYCLYTANIIADQTSKFNCECYRSHSGSETQLLHLGVDKGGLTFPVEQQSAHHQCIEKHKQPLKLQDADGSDHLQRQGKPSLLTQ